MTQRTVSKFEQIVRLVEAELVRHRREMGHTPFEVGFDLFRLSTHENLELPRVAWVPIGGPVEGAHAGTFKNEDGTLESKPLYKAQTQLQAYIFGCEYGDVEDLHHDVLAAVWKCIGQLSNPGVFRWVSQEDDVAAHMLGDNHLVVQPFTWPLTVLSEARLLVNIEAEEEEVCFVAAPPGFSIDNMISNGDNMISNGDNMVSGGGLP